MAGSAVDGRRMYFLTSLREPRWLVQLQLLNSLEVRIGLGLVFHTFQLECD